MGLKLSPVGRNRTRRLSFDHESVSIGKRTFFVGREGMRSIGAALLQSKNKEVCVQVGKLQVAAGPVGKTVFAFDDHILESRKGFPATRIGSWILRTV